MDIVLNQEVQIGTELHPVNEARAASFKLYWAECRVPMRNPL